LKDTRFDPLDAKEIPALYCGVSLLLEFEKCKDSYDWEVGKHGITIDFIVNSRSYGATYLPEVAPEQGRIHIHSDFAPGWNQDETLVSLIEKAGFKGKVTDSIVESLQVERYQSSKASLLFSEYTDMKKTKL
jgi:AMMECR1 domain-containing protein